MNAEFSIGALPSPVINRAPSNIVTGEVPAWPCIWDEQAAKKSTEKHRDTQKAVGVGFSRRGPLSGLRPPRRLKPTPTGFCVSVFFISLIEFLYA